MGILPREASPADQGVRFLIVNGSQALSNKVPEANVILTKPLQVREGVWS